MQRRTQQLIEQLLDWRSPYAPDMDVIEYIDEQAKVMAKKLKRSHSFSANYVENSGELPSTILHKIKDAETLLRRWRAGRDDGTLKSQQLSQKDLSIASDILQFIMLPFARFSHSATDILGKWGGLTAAMMGEDPKFSEALTDKASEMTQQHKKLCRILQDICVSAGYKTGIQLPDAYRLDQGWRKGQ